MVPYDDERATPLGGLAWCGASRCARYGSSEGRCGGGGGGDVCDFDEADEQ